jgi:acetyl esterase
MSAHSRLTPAMRELLTRMHRRRGPVLHQLSPTEARQAYAGMAEVLDLPRAPLARVEDVRIPCGDHDCPARLFSPSQQVLPLLLYLHGGGFVIGSTDTHDSLCRQLALRAGVAVLSLDYRLAPEHRFPAAVNDVWGALDWLIDGEGADALGLDSGRVAVGGDSAGATLSAAAALWARDRGLPLAAQLLITPGTTAHADTESHRRYANGFLIERELILWFFDQYIDRAQRHDWRFAPLEADSVDGVAPACFVLAECDPLIDEGLAYADRLRMAGVTVDLELFRGVTHDFIKLGRAIPEAEAALEAAARFLQQHLHS